MWCDDRTVLFAVLATTIAFWAPPLLVPPGSKGIDMTALCLNVIGCLVISIVTQFGRIKFQYPQTYLMYNGIKGGFCSCFTTFANLVADTGRLLLVGTWYLSIANLVLNLVLSIVAYQVGRLVALRWKREVGFVEEVVRLENPEQRMNYELDKQLALQERAELMRIDTESPSRVHLVSTHRSGSLRNFSDFMKTQLLKVSSKRDIDMRHTTVSILVDADHALVDRIESTASLEQAHAATQGHTVRHVRGSIRELPGVAGEHLRGRIESHVR